MTVDSFEGLMSSLNLDSEHFTNHDIDAGLSYHQLSHIKNDIENQLNVLFDLLTNSYRFDMETPLVTPDGFPRGDVDVVSVRLLRVKIIRLRNDHRSVLGLIEDKLVEQFAVGGTPETSADVAVATRTYSIPFAVVEEVAAESPAASAGLQRGDRIVAFDRDIHAGNHNRLAALAGRVVENKTITVVVKRNGESLELNLVPAKWSGRGLLGCKIVPV